MKKTLLAFTLSTLLTACGGSSDNDSASPIQQTSEKVGVLTDGVIIGANYTINGVTKQTNERGEFEYNEGDEITFSIGNIEIGKVTGDSRITPLELAQDEKTQLNLMIFLQSLDTNGDHDDGITIPANLSLTPNTINFSAPTAEFVQNLQTQFQAIPELRDKTVVTPEKAKENFGKTMLKDIAGTWYVQGAEGDESEIALILKEDGSFIMGEAILNEEEKEFNGMEVGKIDSYDPITGLFTASATIDTNQDWGLTDFGKSRNMVLKFDGTQLHIQEEKNPEESATFSRLPNTANGIVGVWQSPASHIFIFNSNNTYFLLDPVGDDQVEAGDTPCGDAGIEYGKYRVLDNKLYIDPRDILIDTNGCAGLSDTNAQSGLSLNIQADKLSFTVAGEGSYTLSRYK
ncbi:hypothetical protein BS636_00615 [Acinetobacter sp. LoGeW2-3]|uniref:hypothetical protein n=1 Tax=Acinetobacter sp. LoGeW2-3 TaxID=1808001 RepID=UPI000C05AF50|nr:hypothetical protein [Acinetobacter sp. LoGeW2-3]ATO18282.1 hypothetical protein BS636_00615 [Acinetobacter sp. LoGeW2-3]